MERIEAAIRTASTSQDHFEAGAPGDTNVNEPRRTGGNLATSAVPGLIGKAQVMRELYRKIQLVAATPCTVLVLGEPGTGKELVARAIHALSRRKNGPLIDMNMGAIPDTLVEPVLMGYLKGMHSTASKDKVGLFERAHKGTFFMDEVGLTPLDLQKKILRVMQEKQVRRVGGDVSFRLDVRFVAATNSDLEAQVRNGTMRRDFLGRLKVVTIRVPPLRDHLEDLPELFEHFIRQIATEWDLPALADVSFDPAWAVPMRGWLWPENVREVRNTIEAWVTLSAGGLDLVKLASIMEEKRREAGMPATAAAMRIPHRERLELHEKELLAGYLQESDGNVSVAAKRNGLTEPTMRRKCNRFGLLEAWRTSK